MHQNTQEFIRNIRDIYLLLDKNYTPFLRLEALNDDRVDLTGLFKPDLLSDYMGDFGRLAGLGKDPQTGQSLAFSDDFDFTISDRQKAFGTQKTLQAINREIQAIKAEKRPVRAVSLGIGDGKTAQGYCKHLDLAQEDRIIGLDLHQSFLAQAQQNIPGLTPVCIDLNRLAQGAPLPIDDLWADVVESTMVLHHVEQFEPLVAEAARILKKGGSFFYLDLIDKTVKEPRMAFDTDHEYPDFHGVEFFRDHGAIKTICSRHLSIQLYIRVGPGILFLAAKKP